MKILYLECAMGAAGDMLTAALYDLLDDTGKARFLCDMNALGLPGVTVSAEKAFSHGVAGTRMKVLVDGEEEGDCPGRRQQIRRLDVPKLLAFLPLPHEVRVRTERVYRGLAEAEARVHGRSVTLVHFHAMGALDAIADVAGACYALYLLNPTQVVCSPVNVGKGTIRCSAGVLPVPAPATAVLLEEIPHYSGDIKGELCTPTGAALIKEFADSFGPRPSILIEKTGCGMGRREFGTPRFVRSLLGEVEISL